MSKTCGSLRGVAHPLGTAYVTVLEDSLAMMAESGMMLLVDAVSCSLALAKRALSSSEMIEARC